MIAYLEGVLREKAPTRVILDVGGVGYEVFVPLTTFYELPDEGKTIALRIHTHVREDALQLYGFRTARERRIFELLLRTSGVGPRLAQAILSGLAPEVLLAAIQSGNVVALKAIPGVGTKTAERIVVDLRDRVGPLLAEPGTPSPAGPRAGAQDALEEQARSALENLGYGRSQAERVIAEARRELGGETALETLIREALRRLSR
jgi:Holliday junction DNA helicase RuvA